ncbi:MAG: glycosyltransferase [Methylococcales bacterium]|nr:glycosyltransferase [Methylococcales bacterium]
MSSAIKLSIVFLNFNKLSETQYTSETLKKLCIGRQDIEIIAIDNGSVDGTAEFLQAQPHIISTLLPDNTGIAGYNKGFIQAKGEFILVLDDDSCPINIASIDAVLKRFDQNPKIGVIAAHIQSPNQTPQWSWHLPKTNQFEASPFFIGCGFIIRNTLFRTINGYPEDFFLYQNEVAVSFQVGLQGYDIFYDPQFMIVHRGIPSQRPGWRRVFYPTRNTLWLIRTYYPPLQASYMIVSRLIIGFVRATMFSEIKTYFQGLKEGLIHPVEKNTLPHHLRQRFSPFFKQNSLLHHIFRRT